MNFELEFEKAVVIGTLENLLSDAKEISPRESGVHFREWRERVLEFLKEAYTSNQIAGYFQNESDIHYASSYRMGHARPITGYELGRARKALRNIIKNTLSGEDVKVENDESQKTSNAFINEKSKEIFIVHGHNDTIKEQMARVISKLKLDPIILSEQPDRGKTVMEKFEANSDVGFAVVLMTKDDLGASNADSVNESYTPRARQNVIMELGYFIGRLGRGNVCVFKEEGVEVPSDIHGVVYKSLDSAGAWKFLLGKELQAAGYDVDANKLM